ncbi:hypothetical protein [Flagellimonas allohymeniacidonis]|uniref:Uncharacterized protein n=1 Tax=Flagellimonas allohymeniacidonis TaxID=2517819 RepID=A0A4Q8QGM6_9FLAO|nr:hypothetical protein [Allomuricauda hymeniacidonis]TAI49722.1 hypothetical protein EW142_07975 [Allomuricauda hymeniacidonis]
MKRIFFTAIPVLFICCSETTEDIYFTLYNDTDKIVSLRAFARDENILVDKINLPPFSQHIQKQRIGFSDTQSRAFYSGYGVDSVRVIFNRAKVAIYTAYAGENINLEIIYGDNREYHITNKDFSKAMDCSNDCE